MHSFRNRLFPLLLWIGKTVITNVDRLTLLWRDLRYSRVMLPQCGSPVSLVSGSRRLQAWFADPEPRPSAAILILHGIGDRLDYWRYAQQRLASHGLPSLIFHYSGFFESTGNSTQQHLEDDAANAYAWLRAQVPPETPIFVLGFSLGTGIAAAVLPRLTPAITGLILCQAYPTFRQAVAQAVRPLRCLALLFPDMWRTTDTLKDATLPVLLVHGADDSLFPVAMAETLLASTRHCGQPVQLAVIPGNTHNSIYVQSADDYWAPILRFIAKYSHGKSVGQLESVHGSQRDSGIF